LPTETVRFYLDENMQVVIAEQLQMRGIEVVTVRDLGALGDDDLNHLQRATAMGYVLCTYDDDYLRLAAKGIEHAGIVHGHPNKHSIGDWVKGLDFIHSMLTTEDMINRVEYI
jgi:Domain of unknown function (DUF5615)